MGCLLQEASLTQIWAQLVARSPAFPSLYTSVHPALLACWVELPIGRCGSLFPLRPLGLSEQT